MFVCIYPAPRPQAGYDTRSVFKWGTTGLNLMLPFSYTGCQKGLGSWFSLLLNISLEKHMIHDFSKGTSTKRNANILVQVLNSRRPFYFP